jgi:hypothetical protein
MRRITIFFGFFAALLAQGCQGKGEAEMAPMGASAPEFGKTAEHSTLAGFIVGRWCVVPPAGGILPKRYYTFKADGTFEAGIVDGDWKSTGKWAQTQDNVTLKYETMKDKTFEGYRAEYKKDEEGGGQVSVSRALVYDQLYDELAKMTNLWVDEDGKHLTFANPKLNQQSQQGEEMDMSSMMSQSAYALERMAPKSE